MLLNDLLNLLNRILCTDLQRNYLYVIQYSVSFYKNAIKIIVAKGRQYLSACRYFRKLQSIPFDKQLEIRN